MAAVAIPALSAGKPAPTATPDARVSPASFLADRLRQPVEFQIELDKVAQRVGLEVDLILAIPGGSTRTLKTRSLDGRIFRVSAPPVPLNEPSRVRLTLLDSGSEAGFSAADRSFTVGGKTVRLSGVRRIDSGNPSRVVLREGEPLTGPIKGLERIEGQVAGTTVQFETARAGRLLVGEVDAAVSSVIYRIVLRQKGKVIGERFGLLAVSGGAAPAPAVTTKTHSPVAFQPASAYTTPGARDILTAGDLDGDRRPDVVVVADEELGVLYGQRDGTLEPYKTLITWKGKPANRALADLNGDGLPEIIFRDEVGRLVILQNQADRRFAEPRFQDVGGGNAVEVADFNEDGRPDLALNGANSGRGSVKIYLAGEDGSFTGHSSVSVLSYAEALAVRDVNGDKHLDLAVTYVTSTADRSGVSLFYGDGAGKFTSGPSYNIGTQNMPGLALEDLNADGHPDLCVTHYWAGQLVVLLNKGDGTFLPLTRYPAGSYPIQIRSADFNGDGKPDLVTPNAGKGQVSVFLNRGDGTLHDPLAVPSGGENSRSCAIADFNRDGRPDIAVQHESSRTVGVLLNNTGG
ncbi:MAG: FG-GAP repeat domain-containing protein [Actinomycetota bacterium]